MSDRDGFAQREDGSLGATASPRIFGRSRHARYFERGVVYHVVSRTRGNLFLLRPDLAGQLRAVIAGVLAKAKENWPNVANYGTSFLSNHLHAILSVKDGDPRDLADYIAFVKREVSRRWKHRFGWTGSLWEGYHCTALLTPRAQMRALRYVLSQSVKEGLVGDPRHWPGFHCAESLVTGKPIPGVWVDGTSYGKKVHAERAKKEENRRQIAVEKHTKQTMFSFDQLPALADLPPEEYRKAMFEMVEEIVEEGRESRRRSGEKVLGVRAVCNQNPLSSRPVALPEWFEVRRRMIVWDNPQDAEVRSYLGRYWDHQLRFRKAAELWRKTEPDGIGPFPALCFIPGKRGPLIPGTKQVAA